MTRPAQAARTPVCVCMASSTAWHWYSLPLPDGRLQQQRIVRPSAADPRAVIRGLVIWPIIRATGCAISGGVRVGFFATRPLSRNPQLVLT